MLNRFASIHTQCPVTGDDLELEVSSDGPQGGRGWVVHFAKPAAEWWEDIVDT